MTAEDRHAGPARRAVLRWSWRLFRREWRQQILVLALMVVTVAATTVVAALAINASSSHPGFGDATAKAAVEPRNLAAARATVASARERFGTVEVIGHDSVAIPGSAERLDVRAQDPHGVFSGPMLALRDGRYPRTSGEVALTGSVAELLGADVGDRVKLGRVEQTMVGRVENPSDLQDEFVLVPPAARSTAETLTLLFDEGNPGGGGGAWRAAGAGTGETDQLRISVHGDNGQAPVLVLIATTLTLALVGLIAAAGFVVLAQRRQRQFGLLAAIGATDRHLRLVMLANGAIVGALAAVVGVALGIVGWIVASPALETAANHRIDQLDLPWNLIAACALLAVVMATAAAWWPARSLTRLPVMGALSGRPSRPLPVHRSLALALLLLALGVAAIALSHPTRTSEYQPLLMIGGLVVVMVGIVCAAPAGIRILAVPAARLPFAARLALRDLVRYQARAAAALAAITLALAISVAVIAIANANEYRADEGNLSDRQLLIRQGDVRPAFDPDHREAQRDQLDASAAKVAAALGHPGLLPLDVAVNPDTINDPNVGEPISVGQPLDAHSTRMVTLPYVATPQVLRQLGVAPATVRASADLLTSRNGNLVLIDTSSRVGLNIPTSVERVDLPSYTSAPTALVTEHAMRRRGWAAARDSWLIELDRPLTTEQIAAARSAAATVGLTIEARSSQDALANLRTGATAVGALLALAIVAMTIGLIRGESAGDLRTLTATGATSRTRRALTASTAGALAFLGVGLGAAGAYAAMVAGYLSDLDQLLPLPLAHLALLAVGLPLVAAAAGWLLAGREPQTFSRHALD